MPIRLVLGLLFLLPLLAFGQLQINYPVSRLVVQRGLNGNGTLYIAGRLGNLPADRVDVQLTTVGNSIGDTWQTLQNNPTNGQFIGQVTAPGGWYILSVRAVYNNIVVGQTAVQPVGIGEVFVTAGQSNSRGLGIGDNDLGTATDRVSTIDTINHYYPPNASALFSSGDPAPVPKYKALTAGRRIFPMAESSWGWGELGDYIVNRYNVPVAFYVTGWDGTTVENWYNTANGIPTCNRYWCVENFPNLQPYTNLKNVLNYYGSTGGVRAILWHQGEAEYGDAGSGSLPEYANRLRGLIQKTRQDFNNRNVAWVVARASFDGQVNRPEVINKQLEVINTPGLNVFQGPLNDTIINRNAAMVDVHFRNAIRPATHPKYYLNPNSIPTDMGLSRFARNWNNSLDNAFFQNATPIVPQQFIATDNVATVIQPGATVAVAFRSIGAFNPDNQWQVQLLDSAGRFQAVLGSGATSPVSVTLPATYQTGAFRVRVVATSPTLPGIPSNVFVLGTPHPAADLQLSMHYNKRVVQLNDDVTVSVLVHNTGPGRATNVVVQDRLPTSLSFVSGTGVTQQNGIVTGTIAQIDSGATATLTFMVKPIAEGRFLNAAEIMQADNTDPDSRQGSGTGDGEDDAALVELRTTNAGSATFASPNPNQIPLPALQSNQPPTDPTKADLSVRLVSDKLTAEPNGTISWSLVVANQGGAIGTGIMVTAYLPTELQFVAGDDLTAGNGGYTGTIASLPAGSSTTLRFRTQATTIGVATVRAEITAATPTDPDSVAGNGTTNGEDDTAQVSVRVR